MTRGTLCLLACVVLAGCKPPPPEAPTELGDLNLYLYREFESEDPAVMSAGLANLESFLDGLDWASLDSLEDREGREWQPPVLSPEDRSDLPEIEGVHAEDQLAVSVAWASPYSPAQHLAIVGLTDQTPVEAESSASYTRTFLTDADCFLAGDCDALRTSNAIHRDELVLDIFYEAFKDFRRVEIGSSGTHAVLARSWTEERFFGESGQNSIDQSYSLEVWIPTADGTRRLMSYWNQMTIPVVSDNTIVLNLMGAGIDEIFENTDGFLAAQED